MPDIESIRAYLEGEWNAIKAAPLMFFAAVIAVGFLTWLYEHRHYKGRLDSWEAKCKARESTIELLRDELATNKENLVALKNVIAERIPSANPDVAMLLHGRASVEETL